MIISIIIETKIAFNSLLTFINYYKIRDKYKLILICYESIYQFVCDYFEQDDNLIIKEFHENYYYKVLGRLHLFIITIITPKNYSSYFNDYIRKKRITHGCLTDFLSKIVKKKHKEEINATVFNIFKRILNYKFDGTNIIVASRVLKPYLICQRNLRIVTVMESWDHPVKMPAGYKSNLVLCWNKSLADDWNEFQKDKNVFQFYPIKLDFWIKNKKESSLEYLLAKPIDRIVFLYAVGTSSLNTKGGLFLAELNVIEEICKTLYKYGSKLIIKPKPNGAVGDYNYLIARYKNLSIGHYSKVNNTTDYLLTQNYNKIRQKELEECDIVINLYTTFAIDSAIYNKPVLQLDFSLSNNYVEIRRAQNQYHLMKYLLNVKEENVCISKEDTVSEMISNVIIDKNRLVNKSVNFSKRLREWIIPEMTLDDSMKLVEKKICDVFNN